MLTNAKTKAFENHDLVLAREDLGKSIARCTEDGEKHETAIPRLSLFRRNEPTEPTTTVPAATTHQILRRRFIRPRRDVPRYVVPGEGSG